MNEIISELKAERDALRHRLAKIETAIEDYERWAQSVAGLVGTERVRTGSDARPSHGAKPTSIAEFEKEVLSLLERAATPFKRTEIYDALKAAGVVVGGKDPLNTVASRLSRMKGVTNVKGHGYWAEDRPFAPAGYEGTAGPGTDPGEAPKDAFFPETAKEKDDEWR